MRISKCHGHVNIIRCVLWSIFSYLGDTEMIREPELCRWGYWCVLRISRMCDREELQRIFRKQSFRGRRLYLKFANGPKLWKVSITNHKLPWRRESFASSILIRELVILTDLFNSVNYESESSVTKINLLSSDKSIKLNHGIHKNHEIHPSCPQAVNR